MMALPAIFTATRVLEVGVEVDGKRFFEVEVRPLVFSEVMASLEDATTHPRPVGFTEESWERLAERAYQTHVVGLGRRMTLPELANLYQGDVGQIFGAAGEVAERVASFRASTVCPEPSADGGDDVEGAALPA